MKKEFVRTLSQSWLERFCEKEKEVAKAHSRAILARFVALLKTRFPKVTSFGGYMALQGEIDLESIKESIGGTWSLPVIDAVQMTMHYFKWRLPLTKGLYNIPVPFGRDKVVFPEVILVPLLGFDRSCRRVGRGGGFYDRYMTACRKDGSPRTVFIGLAFRGQEQLEVSWDTHDEALDFIVTEQEILEGPCV